MDKPRIGITTGNDTDAARNQRYVDYVRDAGGEPVLLLPRDDRDLTGLDGLLLSGGADIGPAQYGQAIDQSAAGTIEVDASRDQYELPLARRAIEDGLPVLGICRGFQVVNVIQGGSLIQDLAGHRVTEGGHDAISAAHDVSIAPDSALAGLLGAEAIAVNSRHHQAVGEENLAPTLRPVAWSPDGLVEAVEPRVADRGGWLLAVQWHPERVDEVAPECRALARGLVDAAARRASRPADLSRS